MDEKKPLVSRLREDPFQGVLLGLGVLCLWTWLVLPLGRELLTVKRQNEVRKQKLEQLALFAARWDPEQEAREKSLLEQGTREGRLEAREKGEKVLFHGKFITGPVKSSKSGEIHTSY